MTTAEGQGTHNTFVDLSSATGALTGEVVDAGLTVHRALGPGLLEGVYEHCLAAEFGMRGIPFERQKSLPVIDRGVAVGTSYRVDLLVADTVAIEVKAVDTLTRLHVAQLLTDL